MEMHYLTDADKIWQFNPLTVPIQGNDNSDSFVKKVSHSLIAVGAVGVRVPLYLGHS